MDDCIRRCALRDCGVIIENIPGRPERLYCTAGHRAAARQVRRAAMRPEQRARMGAALPVVAEPEPSPVPARGWRRRAAVVLLGAASILAGGYPDTSEAWSVTKGDDPHTGTPISGKGGATRELHPSTDGSGSSDGFGATASHSGGSG